MPRRDRRYLAHRSTRVYTRVPDYKVLRGFLFLSSASCSLGKSQDPIIRVSSIVMQITITNRRQGRGPLPDIVEQESRRSLSRLVPPSPSQHPLVSSSTSVLQSLHEFAVPFRGHFQNGSKERKKEAARRPRSGEIVILTTSLFSRVM